jgi:hypothetical protein
LISTILSWLTNCSCFWRGSCFVKPSADILWVETHLIFRCFLATFCLNQCWCILICLSFVTSLGASLVIRRTVYILLQSAVSSWLISRLILRKKRPHHRSQAHIWASAFNSASVIDVITMDCFMYFQSIVPQNRRRWKPSVLTQVIGSSAKDALLLAVKTRFSPERSPPYSRAKY